MAISDWDGVVEELGPRLYRYFKYKGVGDLSADLTQETLIRLVQKRSSFDSEQGPLVAFALGIAKNVYFESQRKTRDEVEIDEALNLADDKDLHAQLENADQSQKLKLVVARLPQVQQDVLFFFFDEDLTTNQISKILEMPEGTVKSHLHRAKDSLKVILSKEWS
jgi:RNA polymerase sigma-70 factor, ECF subfamily